MWNPRFSPPTLRLSISLSRWLEEFAVSGGGEEENVVGSDAEAVVQRLWIHHGPLRKQLQAHDSLLDLRQNHGREPRQVLRLWRHRHAAHTSSVLSLSLYLPPSSHPASRCVHVYEHICIANLLSLITLA